MEKNILSRHIHIPCYLTDRNNLLTPTAFMDLAQEMAGEHSNICGFGYADLLAERLAWVVSRMAFRFRKTPRWQDDVLFSTWNKGCEDGLFYRREFLVSDPQTGETMVEGTTGWLLLNVDSRAMVRSSALCDRPETVCSDNVMEEPAPRIRIPRGAAPEACGEHAVRPSDIDRNLHTNNAKYALWAMDALPAPDALRAPEYFAINFLHESREGDVVALTRYALPDGRYIVEGRTGAAPVFLAEVRLR